MRVFLSLILLVYSFQACSLPLKIYFCGDRLIGIGFLESEKKSCCEKNKKSCCPVNDKKDCCSQTLIDSPEFETQLHQSYNLEIKSSNSTVYDFLYFLSYPVVFEAFSRLSLIQTDGFWIESSPLVSPQTFFLSLNILRI
ncbi:MAG: hypothetical protein SNJ77_07615 [Cytophagales bacterium]